ncbi:2'-5' RNA ligase family protein [Sphingomonas naphthae]|uniref:2'-5' RNA ligase family protein n=1 Tax=Sphingomonas naphthae TaxID=1813468 RepID=A0ABY7TJY4_9SPHN|nr:2'-5' RNA ligase family protein [Sphingomonas naphthae]WCT73260.1 2'-5' RNA ligase family protein [Sphingomonas naphthae]
MDHRCDRLFLALRPGTGEAAAIGRLVADHRVAGRAVRAEHWHVTLGLIGDFAGLCPRFVAMLLHSLGRAAFGACRLVFDQLVSGRQSVLLNASEPIAGVERLQRGLGRALGREGVPFPDPRDVRPHITLAYHGRGTLRPEERAVRDPILPISWQARELVLIHSHIGHQRHDVLGRWPLVTADG